MRISLRRTPQIFLCIAIFLAGFGFGTWYQLPSVPIRLTPLPPKKIAHITISKDYLTLLPTKDWNIQGKKDQDAFSLSEEVHVFNADYEIVLKQGSNTPSTGTTEPSSSAAASEEIIASKNGTKYYFASCSSARRIKPENRVTFPSAKAAENAGYSASECVQSGTP